MTAAEHIAQLLASAPRLTPAQRDRLAVLLRQDKPDRRPHRAA